MSILIFILLQIEVAEKAIEKSFDVDPTNVYGVLVGFLVLLVIALLLYINRESKRHRTAIIGLVEEHKLEVASHYTHLKEINAVAVAALTSNKEKLSSLITLVQNMRS